MTVETLRTDPREAGMGDPDPSAAEALEDDADEWEPLVAEPQFAVAANAGDPVNEVQSNLAEMLQAVDALLAVESVEGVSREASIDGSDKASSSAGVEAAQQQQQQQPQPEQAPPQPKGKPRRESRLQLRRRLRAARDKVQRTVAQPVARFSVQTTRRMVTGSHDTRVRDFVVKPHVTRIVDKYLFTGGVLGMLFTQFLLLEHPDYFRYYFVALMLPLLILRVVLFQRTKQQYFLLDYCYWVNALGFFVALCPPSWLPHPDSYDILWQVFFVSSNGPLFFAMVAWNNSLVFHSIDKSTSTAIHILPALLSLCERWRTTYAMNDEALTWSRHLGYPLLFYFTWQTVYLLQTEWWHKDLLDADPELSTSLRYLTTAEKMSIHKQTLRLCRSVRLMGPKETFSPPTFKVKSIFVVLQACMTLCTFLPLAWFYRYEWIHTTVVLAILTFSVYNGARYYVQVFSRIYDKRYLQTTGVEEEYVDTSALMTEHAKGAAEKNAATIKPTEEKKTN